MDSNGKSSGRHTSPGLLTGKRVVVTGGSSGIGQGICRVAAREGARVAFAWSENEKGASETEALIRQYSTDCLAIRADLRDPEAAERIVSEVVAAWGSTDALVNNAGVSESIPFVLLGDDDFAELMEINLTAVFRLCRSAVRAMIRQKFGRIVNISSIAGSRSVPGPVHYAASKAAVEGFTRSLAHEVGRYGILVNAIAAGIFEGGLRATIPEHHQRRYVDACSLARFGKPEECGELVAWLISDRNTYMNGSVLMLDGGTLA